MEFIGIFSYLCSPFAFIYNAGQVTAVITLNKDLRTADTYYFYLYNDEQILIGSRQATTTHPFTREVSL